MQSNILGSLGLNDPRVAAQVRRAAQQALARESLVDFAKQVAPWFQAPAHIRYLAALLEKIERGEIKRLAISAPPGHGKSTLLQAFVAWFIGRSPRRRVLALSASEALARRNSRAIRSMLQDDAWPWPETPLVGESLEEWYVGDGGGVRAIGQTGTVTGFRAEMILCDDVQADAGSDTTRETLEEWFRGVLSTRLEPDGVCVLIQTRWRDDDLIGRLQQGESGNQWTFVNLPAIAVEDDPLGRVVGAALWPERWPVDELLKKKAEVGANAFGAQYLGDPAPAGGRLFAPEWFEHRYEVLPARRYIEPPAAVEIKNLIDQLLMPRSAPPSPAAPIVIQAIDSAWRDGLHNDRSVIATLVSDMRDIYVADVWFGRATYNDLTRIVIENYRKHSPRIVYCEEASSGFALVDQLRKTTRIPIVGVPPGRESKEARAESVTGFFEAGRIKFPKNASWIGELISEFVRFPAGRHDDIVDAVVLGIRQMDIALRRVLADERFATRLHEQRDWVAR